jgi:Uncharacterized alpha/beta hydrolase domain (DUF2235)
MTMIYTGRPVPLDGMRKLNAREAAQRDKAMTCVRSPGATKCKGQVHVGLFFDGTGNNDQWTEPGTSGTQRSRNKHSNVARLFDAHLIEPENGFFRYYMPGVGTPFKDIGDTSEWQYDNLGMGLGYRGADRIVFGILSILNSVNAYLTNARLLSPNDTGSLAATLGQTPTGPFAPEGTFRWTALTALEERLASVVQAHQRKVIQINVSIFGFSRGAAEARACAFWLSQICERNNGGMMLAGVPLRIGFMGLFDTVAAVGLGDVTPFTEGHMAWANGTQSVHPAVEDCVHFIALHEQRASFPLEAAVGRGNIGYPGMHSDIGGGYWPGEQGKAMPEWGVSPHLSQIPLLDMHFAAIKGGVPMKTIGEIKADAGLARSFATDERLLATYNQWVTELKIKGGDILDVTANHAREYIRWRGWLHEGGRGGVAGLEFFKRASQAKDKSDLQEADLKLSAQLKFLLERRAANASMGAYLHERFKDAIRLVSPVSTVLVEPGKAPLTAYEKKFLEIAAEGPAPSLATAKLFADYVHDSRAGFRPLGMQEPILLTGGYLRFRHVFKEDITSEARIYGWANQGLATAKATANAMAQFMSDLWDFTVSAYERARGAVAAAGNAATRAVSRAYQSAEQRVWRKYEEAEREMYRQLIPRYDLPPWVH